VRLFRSWRFLGHVCAAGARSPTSNAQPLFFPRQKQRGWILSPAEEAKHCEPAWSVHVVRAVAVQLNRSFVGTAESLVLRLPSAQKKSRPS
jgi:hypothetical protein